MNTYHFSLGNSTNGPMGFCASIKASSREEALMKLKGVFEEIGSRRTIADPMAGISSAHISGTDYVEAYFNTETISLDDIDFWTDADGNEYDSSEKEEDVLNGKE